MKRILIAVFIGLLAFSTGWAQGTAQISGSVKDTTGAVLPGVEVNVTQTETGVARTAITNETGSYVLPNLPLGPYRLEAALPGFRTFVQTGIVLQVGSNPTLDVVLQVGQVTETIEVEANAALVETRSSSIGEVVENERILELPLNGRAVVELVSLAGAATPAATLDGNGGRSPFSKGNVSIAGGMHTGVRYTLDGAYHQDPYTNGYMSLPFPDALQEFKVESGATGAQTGGKSSGSVSLVTKSGTNEFHGSLFEFVRNGKFNARNAMATSRDSIKRNQFGGTIGGPIATNKLFFFAGYQGTTLRQDPSDIVGFVPTEAIKSGATRQTLAVQPKRLSIVYAANGMIMNKWTPATTGAGFELTPILEPLAPFRNQMLVLTGLCHNEGRALPDESTGDHARAGATYLSGVHPRKTEGADTRAGTTVDQITAKALAGQTQLASLEVCVDSPVLLGQCEAGYTCAYMNTLSWSTPTTPVPMENRPRAVFERLFGDNESTDPAVRLRQIRLDRSILDSVTEKVTRMMSELTPADRTKLSEYFEAIRDVERRIQKAEEQSARELPSLERPAGVPARFDEHARLMYDLQVLALQTDLTRVATFMTGREFGARTYNEIGIPDGHHTLTHHQYKQDKIDKVIRINIYQMQHFAYFLERLRSTPDGDGSLLDHTLILYGSSLSDGNLHWHSNLPILLLGSGFKGGRHLRYKDDTPMTNLLLTMLDQLKVPVERLGDSTGRLDIS